MFPVTITIHDNNQLNAVLAAMNMQTQQPAEPAEDKPKAPKTQTVKAKTDTKPEAVESREPEQAAQKEPAASEATEQPKYPDVAALITKVLRAHGQEAAVEILNSFGAKRGPDLKPEQYADVVAACEKVLA